MLQFSLIFSLMPLRSYELIGTECNNLESNLEIMILKAAFYQLMELFRAIRSPHPLPNNADTLLGICISYCCLEGFEPIECRCPVDICLPPARRRQHHNSHPLKAEENVNRVPHFLPKASNFLASWVLFSCAFSVNPQTAHGLSSSLRATSVKPCIPC